MSYKVKKHHKTEYRKDIPMQVFELLALISEMDKKKEPKQNA